MSSKCCKCFKREFRLRNVGFAYLAPERFSMFMWRLPPAVYIGYRSITALYAAILFVFMVTKLSNTGHEGVITWVQIGFSFVTLYLVTHALLVLVVYHQYWSLRGLFYLPTPTQHIVKFTKISEDNDETLVNPGQTMTEGSQLQDVDILHSSTENLANQSVVGWLKWPYQVVGCLYQVSCNVSVLMFCVMFQTSISLLTNEDSITDPVESVFLQVVCMGFVINVFEMCTSAIPTRLLHIIYVQAYVFTAYLVFVIIRGTRDESVDFTQFIPTGLLIYAIYVLPSIPIHLILFCTYHIKCWILQKLYINEIVHR